MPGFIYELSYLMRHLSVPSNSTTQLTFATYDGTAIANSSCLDNTRLPLDSQIPAEPWRCPGVGPYPIHLASASRTQHLLGHHGCSAAWDRTEMPCMTPTPCPADVPVCFQTSSVLCKHSNNPYPRSLMFWEPVPSTQHPQVTTRNWRHARKTR